MALLDLKQAICGAALRDRHQLAGAEAYLPASLASGNHGRAKTACW